jgi:protein-L-isoaspartate(D-aspartate) O-methyltransferase
VDLLIRIAALEQQLLLYKKEKPRPKASRWDRIFWVWLRRFWNNSRFLPVPKKAASLRHRRQSRVDGHGKGSTTYLYPTEFPARLQPLRRPPCPIGHGQTISQPYIVAYMTERMNIKKDEKVLEIGTGSGYQAAILSSIGANIFSIEIVKKLAQHSKSVLEKEGFSKVNVLHGNGYHGWKEHAPYDVILVTCAPEKIPPALVEQLKEGGRMIIPVGKFSQRLVILRKEKGEVIRKNDLNVRFVPMVDNDK